MHTWDTFSSLKRKSPAKSPDASGRSLPFWSRLRREMLSSSASYPAWAEACWSVWKSSRWLCSRAFVYMPSKATGNSITVFRVRSWRWPLPWPQKLSATLFRNERLSRVSRYFDALLRISFATRLFPSQTRISDLWMRLTSHKKHCSALNIASRFPKSLFMHALQEKTRFPFLE